MIVAKIKNHLFLCTIFFLVLAGILFSTGCKRDEIFSSSSNIHLSFSTDTIPFDTIFTTMGSTTKYLIVYNKSNENLQISHIYLEGGYASPFRVTIDGDTTLDATNVPLFAHDSMFIMVKVTIQPNDANLPFEIIDHLVFEYNGQKQNVTLSAWGQNAYYHLANKVWDVVEGQDTIRIPYVDADCSTPWKNDKPHVITGFLRIPEGQTLTMEAGTKVYFSNQAGLWAPDQSTLKIQGTLDQPVVFQGVRTDAYYQEIPGQWDKIWLDKGSLNHEINYAVIKNGNIGLHIETSAGQEIMIKNTIIRSMLQYGIYATNSHIQGENLVVSNCRDELISLIGGTYTYYQCTFANYWQYAGAWKSRTGSSVKLSNISLHPTDSSTSENTSLQADFYNCVITGSISNELTLNEKKQVNFQYYFDHCLIRTQLNTGDQNHFNECIINKDPGFVNPEKQDFRLSPNSVLIDKGSTSYLSLVPMDILGISRIPSPDIGAYEYQPIQQR